MPGTVEARLNDLGVELPSPAAPAANYVPFVLTGKQLFVSGQLPMGPEGLAFAGKVGAEFDIEAGAEAAKLCAINILAQAKAALGDLDNIEQCVKLGAFINAVADFTQHPEVINGASDLIVAALGDKGRHARFALAAGSLPRNAAVEIDAIFAVA